MATDAATGGALTPTRLLADDLTVPDLIRRRAELSAGRTFLEAPDGEITFDAFAAKVEDTARALAGLGVQRGDRVALMAGNRLRTPLWWTSVIAAGGIQVPLNPQHREPMLRYVLEDCAPRVLLVDPALAAELPVELPDCVEHVVAVGPGELPGGWPRRALEDADRAGLPAMHYSDPCAIQYTSGTTGRTKGALSSHRFMVAFIRQMIESWRIGPEDVLFDPFPQYHNTGQLLGTLNSLVSGARLVMDDKFSLSGFWPRVRETRSTVAVALFGTLTLIESLDPSPADTEHDLRLVYSNPAPAEQVARVERRFGFRVRQNYGSTEQGIVACQPYDDARPGSVGPPADHVEIVVADEHDEPVPTGATGEILVRPRRPSSMFSGYWNRPDAMVAATRNQWFHTGDLGFVDEGGDLHFVDRAQDVIKVKGEFVSASELETLVTEFEAVQEVAAVGLPADFGGQEVAAFVVAGPGRRVDLAELAEFCVGRMARFMVPRYLELVDELPRTPNGKVLKAALRSRGLGPAVHDRGARPGDGR